MRIFFLTNQLYKFYFTWTVNMLLLLFLISRGFCDHIDHSFAKEHECDANKNSEFYSKKYRGPIV